MRHELLFPERCALLYEDAVKVKWIYVANALTYQAMHSTCKWESAGKMDRRALKVITVHLATGSSVVNKHWEKTEGLVLASRKGSHLNLIKRYCKKTSFASNALHHRQQLDMFKDLFLRKKSMNKIFGSLDNLFGIFISCNNCTQSMGPKCNT